VCICQPDAHLQVVVPLFNDHFSVVYWPGGFQTIALRLLYFYEFINLFHEVILSILDETHYQLTMMQRSVAKTYIHLMNIRSVPLYHSHDVARGEFSTPLFTSVSFLGETKYNVGFVSLLG
jgi:hypothetical protein